MDTPPFSSAQSQSLKLSRRASAPAEPSGDLGLEARWQLEIDLAGLREREANLRQYEARLRSWQEQLDAGGMPVMTARSASPFGGGNSSNPFGVEGDLRAAWEKLHRARALLEAEQRQVRDERMALRDLKADVERRETALVEREAAIALRETHFIAGAVADEEHRSSSTMRRLTQAPFLAARAVFKSGK